MTASLSPLDQILREAMIAHRAGRIAAAEVGYRRVLRQRPNDSKALHFLGLLLFHEGDREGGIAHVTRCVELDPANARAWNALGGMFIATGRRSDAKEAYRRATEVAPSAAEGWYNLAICERDDADIDSAAAHLGEAIAREPEYARAYEALAMLLYQLGRIGEATALYSQWLERDPSNATARHMAAAASGENTPTRASDAYVRELFDLAAAEFDVRLEQLGYRAHRLVTAALVERIGPTRAPAPASGAPASAVLDAGCGTGLCGPLLRPYCGHLAGVDLSANMVERARARNCYDELSVAELTAFMRSRPNAFDAVIAADTLVYFGALADAFAAARETLRPSGWFIFTVEANEDADHRLEFHGRYAHRESYVRATLEATGFDIEALTHETLRQEREQDVRGFLAVARRR
jgi:predicted TPR repeat methyltransferase